MQSNINKSKCHKSPSHNTFMKIVTYMWYYMKLICCIQELFVGTIFMPNFLYLWHTCIQASFAMASWFIRVNILGLVKKTLWQSPKWTKWHINDKGWQTIVINMHWKVWIEHVMSHEFIDREISVLTHHIMTLVL